MEMPRVLLFIRMAVFVVDHSFESWGNVYNFFGVLRENSDMSEKEINKLSEKFKAGRTDAMLVNLDGRSYYLVYEKSDIQDWMFLGLVQADIVNASMNSLQRSTMLLVGMIVLCIAAFLSALSLQKAGQVSGEKIQRSCTGMSCFKSCQ